MKPLPQGHWGPPLPQLEINQAVYCSLITSTENILRRLLVTDRYDSVSNFLALYEAYEAAEKGTSLRDVFDNFVPMTRPHVHTCVGLGLELIRRWKCLETKFPGLGKATGLISCEETAAGVNFDADFTNGPYELLAPDKEHVLVGVHIKLCGRPGLLLADPGYHVARIITVMLDENYPHTGWFNQIFEDGLRKEYHYSFSKSNSNYIIWREEEDRSGKYKYTAALIYATRAFCDGIRITEKRNLVYKLKSIIRRSHRGVTTAGLYFELSPTYDKARFNLFIYRNGKKKRKRYFFKEFQEPDNDEMYEKIDICNSHLLFPEGKLLSILYRLVDVLSDESFVKQCLELNYFIGECSM